MTNLILMCGVPGAGKSTFIKERIPYAKVESRDAVRFSMVKENEDYFSKEKQVFKTWTDNIKTDLMYGYPVIVADATHLNSASRRKLINSLSGFLDGVKVTALAIETDVNTCIAQNENRKGTRGYVPVDAIKNMAKSYTTPSFDEDEFLDEIFVYKKNERLKRIIK